MTWTHTATVADTTAAIHAVAISPDLRLVAAPGSVDPTLYIYRHRQPDTWTLEAELDAPAGGTRALAATADYIAAGGDGNEVWVYDRANLEAAPTVLNAGSTIYDLVLTDAWLVAATNGAGGEVWATGTWTHTATLSDVPTTARGVDLTPDGAHAYFADESGALVTYATDGWAHRSTVAGPDDAGWSVAATDEYAILGTWRDGLYVYDRAVVTDTFDTFGTTTYGTTTFGGDDPLVARIPLAEPGGGNAIVHHLAHAPDESTLLAAGSTGTLARLDLVGDPSTWTVNELLTTPTTGAVRGATFDPSGAYAAAGMPDGQAAVYDTPLASVTYGYVTPDPAQATTVARLPGLGTTASQTLQIPAASATATAVVPARVFERLHVHQEPTAALATTDAAMPNVMGRHVEIEPPTAMATTTQFPSTVTAAIGAILDPPAASVATTTTTPAVDTTKTVSIAVPTTTAAVSAAKPSQLSWARFVTYHTAPGLDATTTDVPGVALSATFDTSYPNVSELRGEYIRDGEWGEPGEQTPPSQR